ncbi:hypothetical protein HMPREF3202_01097 [Prevotella bivia]|uniref:Uncharacterized protein n=1 Tax=Prevotella bivia TaxID=28125 RepID=A0A137SYA0_9BACT|nr:hypothetical protein HMPREF3202_01097 [Prevotella bivia]
MSGIQACLHIPECRLSYTKIVLTSGIQACLHIAECRLSYTKIVINHKTSSLYEEFFIS